MPLTAVPPFTGVPPVSVLPAAWVGLAPGRAGEHAAMIPPTAAIPPTPRHVRIRSRRVRPDSDVLNPATPTPSTHGARRKRHRIFNDATPRLRLLGQLVDRDERLFR